MEFHTPATGAHKKPPGLTPDGDLIDVSQSAASTPHPFFAAALASTNAARNSLGSQAPADLAPDLRQGYTRIGQQLAVPTAEDVGVLPALRPSQVPIKFIMTPLRCERTVKLFVPEGSPQPAYEPLMHELIAHFAGVFDAPANKPRGHSVDTVFEGGRKGISLVKDRDTYTGQFLAYVMPTFESDFPGFAKGLGILAVNCDAIDRNTFNYILPIDKKVGKHHVEPCAIINTIYQQLERDVHVFYDGKNAPTKRLYGIWLDAIEMQQVYAAGGVKLGFGPPVMPVDYTPSVSLESMVLVGYGGIGTARRDVVPIIAGMVRAHTFDLKVSLVDRQIVQSEPACGR